MIELAPPGRGFVLALGGGGARGFAHLGVLRVLERERIPVSGIVGTSMGAIIGGVIARIGSAEVAYEHLRAYVGSREFRGIPFDRLDGEDGSRHVLATLGRRVRESFVIAIGLQRTSASEERFRDEPVHAMFGESKIEDFAIPFVAVAVDLLTGEVVTFPHGSAFEAVRASSSIIGVFPPVNVEGRWLVDGGCARPVPVAVARERYPGPVIAVSVPPDLEPPRNRRTVLDVLVRESAILDRNLADVQADTADVVLRPRVGGIFWNEFNRFGEAVAEGESSAKDALPAMRDAMRRFRLRGARRRLRRITDWFGVRKEK